MFIFSLFQGVGEISVYGPSGLSGALNLMLPFINRKYPVLKVIEIDEKKEERIKGGVLSFIPVKAVEVCFVISFDTYSLLLWFLFQSSRVLALSFSFTPSDDSSFHFDEPLEKPRVIYIPCSVYFETHPSIEELNQSFNEGMEDDLSHRILIFSPLTSDSQLVHQIESLSSPEQLQQWISSDNLLYQRIAAICEENNCLGFVNMVAWFHFDLCFLIWLVL
jgi:hypothetical protein